MQRLARARSHPAHRLLRIRGKDQSFIAGVINHSGHSIGNECPGRDNFRRYRYARWRRRGMVDLRARQEQKARRRRRSEAEGKPIPNRFRLPRQHSRSRDSGRIFVQSVFDPRD